MPKLKQPKLFRAGYTPHWAPALLCAFRFLAMMCVATIISSWAYAYDVRFSGDYPKELQSSVESRSLLWQDRDAQDRPPHQLRFRLRQDQTRLQALLQSEAYYAAEIGGEVSGQRVEIKINAGPRFTLAAPILAFSNPVLPSLSLTAADIGLQEGAPATAGTVLAAKDALLKALKAQGYLSAEITCEALTADHALQVLQVKWCVAPGAIHVLSGVRVMGLESIDEGYVRAILSSAPGVVLTPAKRDRVIEDLITTGLFARVTLQDEIELVEGKAQTTLIINVVEAEHRTLSAGLAYDTARGLRGSLGWEHRNILGRGEKLLVEVSAAEDGHEGRISFVKPHFTQKRRTLRLNTSYVLEETDAYDIEKISAGVDVEQKQNAYLTLTAGAEIDTTLEDFGRHEDRFSLLTPFLAAVYDTRDSLLDPTGGFRVSGRIAPSIGVIDTAGQFVTVRLGARTYVQPGLTDGVLALRVGVASLVGGSRLDIPSDRLLFAGGGGSVRGFAYQSVGPRDVNRVPLGGRSLLEASAEWRQPITQDYGLVVFVDSGLIGPARLPQADDTVAVGAGLGVRYQTPVGPLRFDIGVPVTRRAGDDPFQIYISIGQAF